VFGLGDKTYEHFNKMGKVIDKRLEALGGERVVKRGDGDSDANIEEDFLRWKKDFWTEVARVFNVTKTEGKVQRKSRAEFTSKDDPAVANVDVDRIPRWRPPAPAAAGATRRRIYDTKNPFLAKIVVNRELHSPSSDRSCRHIEIEVGDAINYEAGDHVGIFPVNDLTLVHKLAARLGADLEQVVTLYNTEDPLIKAPIIGPVTLKVRLFCSCFRNDSECDLIFPLLHRLLFFTTMRLYCNPENPCCVFLPITPKTKRSARSCSSSRRTTPRTRSTSSTIFRRKIERLLKY
jgi:NADPH-ferrihemoprotein reductase